MRKLQPLLARLCWPERLLLMLVPLWVLLRWQAPASALRHWLELVLAAVVFAVILSRTRALVRKATWRLRNRLLVVYGFIAVVPLALVLALVLICAYILTGQAAVFMVSSELDRYAQSLLLSAQELVRIPAAEVPARFPALVGQLQGRHPGLALMFHKAHRHYSFGSPPGFLPLETTASSGLARSGSGYHLWARASAPDGTAELVVPLTRELLDLLAHGVGEVTITELLPAASSPARPSTLRAGSIPPARSRFDPTVNWFTLLGVANRNTAPVALSVITRPSAILRIFFGGRSGFMPGFWSLLLYSLSGLFLVFVVVALAAGIKMTRKITSAVHELYEGTRRVREGDFSHRIEVKGSDQLAELGRSFNLMTENLERLLHVEKEKERLQSEIEIAREVQNQLYPRTFPSCPDLEIWATCHPARIVSGDYYDCLELDAGRLAFAIGDVAGKGISAALLMATIQATFRTQVKACFEPSPASDSGAIASTSRLVDQLNQQLYAFTSPEKFATFYFAIYDPATGLLTYTNAGHPPPILVRDGGFQRLDTNGMVVGAFPNAAYSESVLRLEPGDLLVCFTDGLSEAENEYAEMFGEQRLCELLLKNARRPPQEIAVVVLAAVTEWMATPEAADDMTLLIARRSPRA